jgi:hypothetical protein
MRELENYLILRIRQLRKRGIAASGRIDELTRLGNIFLATNKARHRTSWSPIQTEEEFTNKRKKLRENYPEAPDPVFFSPPKELFEKKEKREIPKNMFSTDREIPRNIFKKENKEVNDGKEIN